MKRFFFFLLAFGGFPVFSAFPLEVYNFSGTVAEFRFTGASFYVPPGTHDLGTGHSGAFTIHLGSTNQIGGWNMDDLDSGHKAVVQLSDSTVWVTEPRDAYGAAILGINLALGVFATSIGYHFVKQIGKNNPEV